MRKKHIALFGGAFNPPHNGHSAVVKALDSLDGIDEIWLMPSANRWDKKISVPGPDRLRMIDLMMDDDHFRSRKPIRAFDHEIRKPNLSTTYETKAELEKLYPYHEFHFVCGSDIISDIPTKWVNGKELFDTCNFIFIERPGLPPIPKEILPPRYKIVSVDSIQLSSTFVRSVAKNKDKLSKCVSPSVARFIEDHKLYFQ